MLLAIRAVLALALLSFVSAASAAQVGMASWYGSESGSRTAEGKAFNPSALIAAHRLLPFGARVRVTDTRTQRSVVVRIGDRGPAARTGRIIDLSRGAASRLGIISRGTARVRLDVLG